MDDTLYILDEKGTPVPEQDVQKWGKWFSEHRKQRTVSFTRMGNDVNVSTVFLGTDYQWGKGPPLLFETMVFGGQHDQYTDRYSTREQAIAGHARIVDMVKGV